MPFHDRSTNQPGVTPCTVAAPDGTSYVASKHARAGVMRGIVNSYSTPSMPASRAMIEAPQGVRTTSYVVKGEHWLLANTVVPDIVDAPYASKASRYTKTLAVR